MTLSTSASKRALYGYLIATGFCIVFSAIYEYFSHQVYSIYMIGMFLFPLLLGVVPTLLGRFRKIRPAGPVSTALQQLGVGTLTVGSCVTGIFEIYGSASGFTIYYWIIGAGLITAAVITYLASCVTGVQQYQGE